MKVIDDQGSGNHVTGNYGDCASDCPGAGAQPTSAPTVPPANCRSIVLFWGGIVFKVVVLFMIMVLIIEPPVAL